MARGKLEDALGRLAGRRRAGQGQGAGARPSALDSRTRPEAPQISLSPGCAYGVRYAQLLEDLQKDLAEVKARLNGLLFLLAGTVALDVVIRLIR